jgi:hypothetical protein
MKIGDSVFWPDVDQGIVLVGNIHEANDNTFTIHRFDGSPITLLPRKLAYSTKEAADAALRNILENVRSSELLTEAI